MLKNMIIRGVAGSLATLVLVSGGATVLAGNGHATNAMATNAMATCADRSTPASATTTRPTAGMMHVVSYATRKSPSTLSQRHQAMGECATGHAVGGNGK
jgi:hypothetical protein